MPDPLSHTAPSPTTSPIKRCKNIVVCCDGTGNKFGDNNSNVVRLYTALCVSNDQVAYYHPGVGTMGAPTEKTKLGQRWSRLKGLAFAAGFRDNVLDAYRYLMETYDDGDHIFLLGFSRGAYTVRALAGMIHRFGLLCRGNEGHIPYVWQDFRQEVNRVHRANADNARRGLANRTVSVDSADAFKETFSHPNLKLHFVGLWDTVSSVGWITEPLQLLYTAQNPSMCIARHAVAIDERRCFYQDNLWGHPTAEQDMLQVWFPGAHSDVGGSYANTESFLSNNALNWLMTEAEAAGLRLDPERRKMVLGQPFIGHHAAANLYRPAPLPTSTELPHHSLHGPWLLLEILPHRFYDKSGHLQRKRVPLGRPRQIPNQALVHASAIERMDDPQYAYGPPNLPRAALTPVQQPLPHTSADTSMLYRFQPGPGAQPKSPPAPAAVVTLAAAACTLLGGGALLLNRLRRHS